MLVLFWFSIFAVFFAYFGYPASLKIAKYFKRYEVSSSTGNLPSASLIITAFNESKRIQQKIDNTLALAYPENLLEIIIASDGSDDGTNEIVERYQSHRVKLLDIRVRKGKENAQREAVRIASGDVLVFSDVATMIPPEGLKQIVSNFADPKIGCVSSVDRIIDEQGNTSGEGLYVRYEMWLRQLESRVNSLVGLSGSFFAARKEVCQDFSPDMQSDFRTLLSSIRIGLRGISDPRAIGYYKDIENKNKEFDRKVRTVLRGQTVFFRHLGYLNPLRYGFFAYQYFCHKLLRWLVPFFAILILISNLFLAFQGSFFYVLLLAQVSFYAIGAWYLHQQTTPSFYVLNIPVYFVTVNLAILAAWSRFVRGQRVMMWTPTQR
jgi:glycosyltransferase involved in cell wall biosynthesis